MNWVRTLRRTSEILGDPFRRKTKIFSPRIIASVISSLAIAKEELSSNVALTSQNWNFPIIEVGLFPPFSESVMYIDKLYSFLEDVLQQVFEIRLFQKLLTIQFNTKRKNLSIKSGPCSANYFSKLPRY